MKVSSDLNNFIFVDIQNILSYSPQTIIHVIEIFESFFIA